MHKIDVIGKTILKAKSKADVNIKKIIFDRLAFCIRLKNEGFCEVLGRLKKPYILFTDESLIQMQSKQNK